LKPQLATRDRSARSADRSPVALAKWKCDWIPTLAEPYLRGYAPQLESGDSLIGYRFLAQRARGSAGSGKGTRSGDSKAASAGFFIGYLLDGKKMPSLKAASPEFLIFCFIEPVGGSIHQRLVKEPDSLIRRTAEYIRWLTHHLPRFELFADDRAALVRHIPVSEWPTDRLEHFARNFTIETLAWLVRSALVRRLPDEIAARPSASSARAKRKERV
jgi:hypothetical protein